MPYYETVFIARQDLTDAQVKEITTSLSKIITDMGGKIAKTEFWGLKTFAYKINKARKGHYVLLEMETAPEALHEMERQMGIHEDVVRHQSLRLEALTEGPSVMMDKGGRDDDKKRPYNNRDDNNTEKEVA